MHSYNVFPPTFISSALCCDQFNPFKTVNIAPLTLASFDLTHTVSSPENTLNDCCFFCVPSRPHKGTNPAISGRAICKRWHRRTEHLVRTVIDVRNNRDNRPR